MPTASFIISYMSGHVLRLLLSFAILVSGCLPAFGLSAPLYAAFGASSKIDISGLKPFLDTLPPDEKAEQLRDWALYGVKSILALTSKAELPVRHPALKDSQQAEVSPGRLFSISSTEWGIVAAPELIGNKPLLGRLIDEKFAACNCLPATVSLFTYSADTSSTTISLSFAGSLKAKDLFTPEYGYHSAAVSTLADFNNFAARIDDVVSFQWQAGGFIIGGRKYLENTPRALTIEEIASLYQAYNTPVANGHPAKKSQRPMKPAETDVGFSLDQRLNYAGLAEDLKGIKHLYLEKMQAVDPSFAALLSRHNAELLVAVDRLTNQQDIRSFHALRRRYKGSSREAEARFSDLLKYIEGTNSYQEARYNGNLQGTSAGMILFYTDLLAKLWVLDYNGIAPNSVLGFRTMRQINVPRLYRDDLSRLSKTRLWFGLRQEGFELYGNKILFQPVATRVYAASSDPMLPGKEGKLNYPSREFLGWWNTHYDAMAAAEPYYHKLNQIQKWSCIFMTLKENKIQLFDFLMSVPVRHNLDFETWDKSRTKLAKVRIPFLDRRKYGCINECLPLLSSRSNSPTGKPFLLSGGVSLATREDIMAKLHKHNRDGTGRAPVPAPDIERTIAKDKYGTFSSENRQGAIRLQWTKGPSLAPHELVASLAALQEAKNHGLEGEEIFKGIADIKSVVRIKKWSLYLIKTAASMDAWIYLAVNPAKADEYPANASASFPDADIFCARLISDSDARKLTAGKPVVR